MYYYHTTVLGYPEESSAFIQPVAVLTAIILPMSIFTESWL